MRDDILYSPETSALLLALTALQTAQGVPARDAIGRAYEIWRDHDGRSWEASELTALVDRLTSTASHASVEDQVPIDPR